MVRHLNSPSVFVLFLDREFPACWIGREGLIPWSSRSTDLTPLEFLFWWFVKDIVCREKLQNVIDFRDRIVTAAECVTNEMFVSTWRETEYRLDVCRATNYAHIEMYWAHKELCEVQCLKMYRFLQYI
jgi:hypothetical protein